MKTLLAAKKISETFADLSQEECAEVFDEIMSGSVPEAAISAFLVAQKMKGVSVGELVGAAKILRKKAAFINAGVHSPVDTCGTGGDGLDTFNISTTSAFIASGAGVCVAKHGGSAVSGKCGSADVLARLGFNTDASPAAMEYCLQENNIAFLFAPKMHPAWRYAMPVRRLLGFRTIFNMLGPLVNPAGATGQVLGVFSAKYTELFANALKLLGARRALVVHGGDGMDEITICAPTRISELRNGSIKTYEFRPESVLGSLGSASDLRGGDPEYNAKKLLAVLRNEDKSGARDVCILNSAAAIIASGICDDFPTACGLAKESLESGRALEKLEILIKFSKEK
ncbi:MAG: anthranilate phosphoribosyltransferase [Opitutales bacterium]|nr:anthranilate phosphoribosyltransferase [Opitutales bacterium]